MNLVIVDDEAQIRGWFEHLVQKTGVPVRLIASCSNGKEALDVCLSEPVDLVITDIRMPVMDGLAFIKRIKAERPSCHCLILSSYSEFQFASEAIKAGADDYILKAEVTVEGLREALLKAQHEIERERTRDREMVHLKSALNERQYALRSLYFTGLAQGKLATLSEFEEKMEIFRIRLQSRHLAIMVICSSPLGDGVPKIQDPDLLDSAVINIIDETLLDETGGGCSFIHGQGMYAAIFNNSHPGRKSWRELSSQCAGRIAEHLREYLGLAVSIVIRPPAADIGSLGEQLEKAMRALLHDRFYAVRRFAFHADPPASAPILTDTGVQQILDALTHDLADDRFDEALDRFRIALDTIGRECLLPEQDVKSLCRQAVFLSQMALRRLNDRSGGAAEPQEEDLTLEEGNRLTTFLQLREWALDRVQAYLNAAKDQLHPYSEAIRKVCELLQTQYAADISLQQAADLVHLNRNYLSELFKKETGSSFSDYITQIRIRKAKELILAGDTTIGLLAERVGYPDGSYLSKVFKKVTGLTPLEFKQGKR